MKTVINQKQDLNGLYNKLLHDSIKKVPFIVTISSAGIANAGALWLATSWTFVPSTKTLVPGFRLEVVWLHDPINNYQLGHKDSLFITQDTQFELFEGSITFSND